MPVVVNIGYVKSIPGILRIVEFVLLLLAWACAANCCGNGGGRYAFFLFVTIVGWLLVGALFVLFLLSLESSIPQINWQLFNIIFAGVMALMLLIAASLLADQAEVLRKSLQVFKHTIYERLLDTIVAAAVFGFFALVAFVVDCVLCALKLKSSAGNNGNKTEPVRVENA